MYHAATNELAAIHSQKSEEDNELYEVHTN